MVALVREDGGITLMKFRDELTASPQEGKPGPA